MTTSRWRRIDRRRLVVSSAIGGAAVLTGSQILQAGPAAIEPATVLAQDSSAGVPMFQGNAARTGVMPGPGPDDTNGVEVIWRFDAQAYGSVFSSPAVVDGVILSTCSDNLYAIDSANGSELWRFNAEGSLTATPAVVDGVVFVGGLALTDGGGGGYGNGNLYAVNATDGSQLWRFSLTEQIWSSPAVVDGVVFVSAGDSNTNEGNLYAVNATDGSELWRFPTGSPRLQNSPAVVDGVVFVGGGDGDGNLYAVNATDGSELWRFPTGDTGQPPVVVDSVVFVGSDDGNLYAVDTREGTERWRFLTGDSIWSSPAVVDGVVYVRSTDGNLYAVDAHDGTERWRYSVRSESSSSPSVADGLVYMGGSADQLIRVVDTVNGSERWRFGEEAWSFTSPVVIDGLVFVSGPADTMDTASLFAIGARVPKLSVGGMARVTEKTALRGGPSSTAVERTELELDTVVTIVNEAEQTGNATWWPVTVNDTGAQGWVDASMLEPLTSGPESTETP